MILVGLFWHTDRALLTLCAHVTRARALEYVNMPNVSVGQVTCTSSDHVCETSSHARTCPRMRTHTAAAPMLADSPTAGYFARTSVSTHNLDAPAPSPSTSKSKRGRADFAANTQGEGVRETITGSASRKGSGGRGDRGADVETEVQKKCDTRECSCS